MYVCGGENSNGMQNRFVTSSNWYSLRALITWGTESLKSLCPGGTFSR